jgi:hypothetical protein
MGVAATAEAVLGNLGAAGPEPGAASLLGAPAAIEPAGAAGGGLRRVAGRAGVGSRTPRLILSSVAVVYRGWGAAMTLSP